MYSLQPTFIFLTHLKKLSVHEWNKLAPHGRHEYLFIHLKPLRKRLLKLVYCFHWEFWTQGYLKNKYITSYAQLWLDWLSCKGQVLGLSPVMTFCGNWRSVWPPCNAVPVVGEPLVRVSSLRLTYHNEILKQDHRTHGMVVSTVTSSVNAHHHQNSERLLGPYTSVTSVTWPDSDLEIKKCSLLYSSLPPAGNSWCLLIKALRLPTSNYYNNN